MLIANGQPVELDAHLGRLAESLAALFNKGLPERAAALAYEKARDIDLGRLRLTVVPNGPGELAVGAVASAIDPAIVFPSWERAIELASVVVEGGFGAHKWVDRTPLENTKGEAVTLLLDEGGVVLEASRANVFVAREGKLLTPPADGRILSGIARKRAIGIAREENIDVREVNLKIDDLLQADEVFLTGSVRGIEPVGSIDGIALSAAGEICSRLSSGLRQRWLG